MTLRRWVPVLAAGCLLAGSAQAADKLSKEDKQWLEVVRPIMLPDEDKTYRALNKGDRAEFQKIFWARRDPDLDTPVNEFQVEYDKQRAVADERFKAGGKAGSATDCGRLFVLLGEPNTITPGESGRQTWTYQDRPGVITFKGGQLQVEFEPGCMLPQGLTINEAFARLAEDRVTHPNLRYPLKADGRLTSLVDQLPKPTPGQALLKTPRQDFPASIDTSMFLRSPGGATYMAGLFRGDATAGLTAEDVAGKKTARVQVVMHAVEESGRVNSSPDRDSHVDLAADGSFVVSYGMALRPGKYTLSVGVLDPKTGKGSVVTSPLEMPNLSTPELTTSSFMVLGEIREGQAADPNDPYASFTLGTTQFLPRHQNVFTPADSITLLAALYNAQVDPATGKPSVTAAFKIQKDGKTVAEADPQTFDSEVSTPSVGPVPLTKFLGKYTAQIVVKDNVASKELTRELAFEVR